MKSERIEDEGRTAEHEKPPASTAPHLQNAVARAPIGIICVSGAKGQYLFANGQLTANTRFLTPCTGGQGCTAAIAASTGPRIVQLAAKASF